MQSSGIIVIKRSGRREKFDLNKIKSAIKRTGESIGVKFTESDWKELKPRIDSRLKHILTKEEVFVTEIDDVVADALLRSRFKDIATEYIATRSRKRIDRINDLGLSDLAVDLIKERYLLKDENGRPIETVSEMLTRVGKEIALAEPTKELRNKYGELFANMLTSLRFLPNSPCLASAGTKRRGTYVACFAYDIEDSLDSIFSTLKKTALTFQLGGGVGISVSNLRERGCPIETTNGHSSGPISFMHLFDTMVESVKSGGFRRGALMVLMDYTHPDIEQFISCKREPNVLTNMNISVKVDEKFINAVKENKNIKLRSPRTGRITKTLPANQILEMIAMNMWETGEPGVLFEDNMNKDNPTPHLGLLKLVNPCSESVLYSNEVCALGSINLVRHMINGSLDWDMLAETTRLAVRFLDDMIEVSHYPDKDVVKAVKRTRKIGLGVMGFADMLILMGIKYSSKKAIAMADRVMSFINDIAIQESIELGKEKGLYEGWKDGSPKRRNAIVTTQAPTGSLSLICGVSSGIEPNFARQYSRLIGDRLVTVKHPLADRREFETTYDIPPEHHLEILAAFQRHIENSVSKTINVPEHITVDEIKELIIKAHELGCKGITIFRQNCKRDPLIRCEECKI